LKSLGSFEAKSHRSELLADPRREKLLTGVVPFVDLSDAVSSAGTRMLLSDLFYLL